MCSESKILKFTLDLGFTGIANIINFNILVLIYIYLRCQQERGLVQKARHLIDQNSVSFQMFLILLSSITLGSESQIPTFKEGRSNT